MCQAWRRTSLVVIFVIGINRLDAQVTTATILGVVTDTSNAVMSGVSVQAKHVGTGAVLSVSTDAAGRYVLPNLPILDKMTDLVYPPPRSIQVIQY